MLSPTSAATCSARARGRAASARRTGVVPCHLRGRFVQYAAAAPV